MSPAIKKLFLFLSIVIVLGALLLAREIRRARTITIETKTTPVIAVIAQPLPSDKNDYMLGNPGAPLTLTVFADIGDASSKKLISTLTTFVVAHPAEARLIWKDYPREHFFSGDYTITHEAAYCAGKQKQFWPFTQTALTTGRPARFEEGLKNIAVSLKLDTTDWWNCTVAPETARRISESAALAKSLGIETAPALFVNNKRINLQADIDLTQMLTTFIQK